MSKHINKQSIKLNLIIIIFFIVAAFIKDVNIISTTLCKWSLMKEKMQRKALPIFCPQIGVRTPETTHRKQWYV
jgi:hypothetical protein